VEGTLTEVAASERKLTDFIKLTPSLQRTELGDPSFLVGLQEYEDQMLNDTTAAEIRAKISDSRTQNVSYYDPSGLESLETPGTSHIVTADASGMAISLTTTVNLLFGSHLMVPETGVIMNNEMYVVLGPDIETAWY